MHRYRLCATVEFNAGADSRAAGGAVTVALCGHWEHEGACRWPHYTETETIAHQHRLTIDFTCEESDLDEVSSKIHGAIKKGRQAGPDGSINEWQLISIEASPSRIN